LYEGLDPPSAFSSLVLDKPHVSHEVF